MEAQKVKKFTHTYPTYSHNYPTGNCRMKMQLRQLDSRICMCQHMIRLCVLSHVIFSLDNVALMGRGIFTPPRHYFITLIFKIVLNLLSLLNVVHILIK